MAMLAMVSLPSLAQAQAQTACVSRAEANALFMNTIPDLIEGMRNKCAASLPSSAFLPSQGQALVARYRAIPPADWGLARSAFVKMMGSKDKSGAKMMAAMPDEALKGLLGTAFTIVISERMTEKDCPMADRFIGALSPLPPSNIATIVTELMVIGSRGDRDGFRICPEG